MSDTDRARLIDAVFHAARARPDVDRAAFVLDACAGDEDVAAEVIARLEAADAPAAAPARPATRPGDDRSIVQELGRFELLGHLGGGWTANVYKARQRHPQQLVAIKILSSSAIQGETHLKRFLADAARLQRLDHSAIAGVIDTGVGGPAGGRRPWIVAEYVEGEALNVWMRHARLSIPERLELLAEIAAAVHHAHLRGVLHLNLKPENIIVDGDGAPHLTDFGIADSLAPDAAANGRYQSPEQAEGDPLRIDARSDIYALGVLAYEVLAGEPPYKIKNPNDAARIIRNAEPTPLGRMVRSYKGDIERVVAHAMDRKLDSRYQSAHELAEDLRRCHEKQPVSLHGARKGGGGLGAAVLLLLFIVALGAAGAAGWFSLEAGRERDRMANRAARFEAIHAGLLEDAARPGAAIDVRRRLAERTAAALETLELTSDAAPEDLLRVASLHRRLGDLQGGARSDSLGDAASALASYEQAIELIGQAAQTADPESDPDAFGRAHADVYEAIAQVQIGQNRADAALAAAEDAIAALTPVAARDPDPPFLSRRLADLRLLAATAEFQRGEAASARARYQSVINSLGALNDEYGDDLELQRDAGEARLQYAYVLGSGGDLDAAAAMLEEAAPYFQPYIEANPGDEQTIAALVDLLTQIVTIRTAQGRFDAALDPAARAEIVARSLIQIDPRRLRPRELLAHALERRTYALTGAVQAAAERGDVERAREYAETALRIAVDGHALAELLVDQQPTNAAHRRRLTVYQQRFGELLTCAAEYAWPDPQQRIDGYREALVWFDMAQRAFEANQERGLTRPEDVAVAELRLNLQRLAATRLQTLNAQNSTPDGGAPTDPPR